MDFLKLFHPSDSDGVSVPDVVAAYLNHLSRRVGADDYSADAFSNMDRELTRFAQAHRYSVLDCKQHDLAAWLDENPTWQSGHTKKRVIGGIVSCFRWAADEELINRCPYRRVRAISNLPYQPRRPAEASEYVALMRWGSRSLRRALFFLRRTGARTCEMRELLWSDCLLDGLSPHICLYKHKTMRTSGKPRKLGLDPSTARWLCSMRSRAASEYVFTNCDGGVWDRHTFSKHLRRWCQRLGVDDGVDKRVSGACWRQTYAVDGVEAGISTRQIADQLGHATTAMVDRVYARSTREREEYLARVAAEIQRKRVRKTDG